MAPADELFRPYAIFLSFVALIVFLLYEFNDMFQAWIYQPCYAYIVDRIAFTINKVMGKKKTKLFASLHDLASSRDTPLRILEIGAGGGANFEYFPDGTKVVCLDPKPAFQKYLKRNAAQWSHVIMDEFIVGPAEYIPEIKDESVDAVVCTLVMCSVQSVNLCLREIKRVLKPGCSLYFMEHVRANDKSWCLYLLQRCLEPFWKRIADNCHVTRRPWLNMEEEGFQVNNELFDSWKGNKLTLPWNPHCMGTATKPQKSYLL